MRGVRLCLTALAAWLAWLSPAWGHSSERGFVLLLPTDYYVAGGTLAVVISFLVLLLVPAAVVRRVAAKRLRLCGLPRLSPVVTSGASFALLLLLVLAGFLGSRDPLANPLPLVVWTLWWVGLILGQALFGNLWALLNPWIAPSRLLRRLWSRREQPLLAYPAWLGYWPAVLGFAGFAWFELIDPAPDDPARLALAVVLYSAITLAGLLLFGEAAWLARGECFSVFFGLIARLAPLQAEGVAAGRPELFLVFPGAALARRDPLPLSGLLFVLLTLAAVSFDGLSKTFWWLDLGGINPLEFPGRTSVMERNSLGLAGLWAALAAAYAAAILLGWWLAGRRGAAGVDLGSFVLSILPISLGYHFAHYLTVFLVNAQYAGLALADPFARGWDLFGLEHGQVTVSFLSNYADVKLLWSLQAAGVVLGHVVAVWLAHAIGVARYGTTRAALLAQLPLTLLMIGYTVFGLWLLAAPTAG